MKGTAYIFGLIFLGISCYLMWNHFQLPTIFLDKTEKTKAIVTKTEWTHGTKGYGFLQLVTYEFTVNDSTYRDFYKAGQQQGARKVGDRISIEYSIKNPAKNKVVGYFKDTEKSIEPIILKSKKSDTDNDGTQTE